MGYSRTPKLSPRNSQYLAQRYQNELTELLHRTPSEIRTPSSSAIHGRLGRVIPVDTLSEVGRRLEDRVIGRCPPQCYGFAFGLVGGFLSMIGGGGGPLPFFNFRYTL